MGSAFQASMGVRPARLAGRCSVFHQRAQCRTSVVNSSKVSGGEVSGLVFFLLRLGVAVGV